MLKINLEIDEMVGHNTDATISGAGVFNGSTGSAQPGRKPPLPFM